MRTYDDNPDANYSFQPSIPSINFRHVDGPLLSFSDGQLHWLSWRERLRVWFGLDDAESLQKKLRPRLSATLEHYWAARGA